MRVITGTARGMTLKAPKGMDTRPTMDQVKEGIFSAIQFEVEGRRALDLFAGSGQLGIEALSRGAREAVFVDARRDACQVQMDYLSYLGAGRGRFDLVFLDPPYAEVFLENALKRISEIDILTDGGIIICERPVEKALADDFPGLTHWRDYKYGKTAVTIFRKAQRA